MYDDTDSYVRRRKQGNTGPKGVLADYAEAKERLRLKNEYEAALAEEKMRKASVRVRSATEEKEAEKLEEEEDLLDELDSDDDFMMEFKAKRLAEIQQQLHKSTQATFGFVNLLICSYLRTCNADQYLDAIDEDHGAVVVVHLDQSVGLTSDPSTCLLVARLMMPSASWPRNIPLCCSCE